MTNLDVRSQDPGEKINEWTVEPISGCVLLDAHFIRCKA